VTQRELSLFSGEDVVQSIYQMQDGCMDLLNSGTTNLMQYHNYGRTRGNITLPHVERQANIQQWIAGKFRWRPYPLDRSAYRITLNFEARFEPWLSDRLSELIGNYNTSHRCVDLVTGNVVYQKREWHAQNNWI